jgi:hypothetical protein
VDRERAALGVGEVDVGVDGEGRRAAVDGDGVVAARAHVSVNPPVATSTGSLNVTPSDARPAHQSRRPSGSSGHRRRAVGWRYRRERDRPVGGERVGRIVRVLVGDLRGVDGERARLPEAEIGRRVEGEGGRAAGDAKACAPLLVQSRVNAPLATSTGSLNATPRLSATGTLVVPSAGAMPVTVGASSGGIVRNENVLSRGMRSGGSIVSRSVTERARTAAGSSRSGRTASSD